MRRASLLALMLIAACEGKKPPAAQPTPPPKDAAVVPIVVDAPPVNPTAGTGEPARRRPARYLDREAALPKRTPCKATCDEQHMSPAANACYRRAQEHDDMAGTADITLIGERTPSGTCGEKSVVIDCCPPLDPRDLTGIAKRLGWAKATIEERKAIAWVIARVAIGGTIVDEDFEQTETDDQLAMPTTNVDHGGVALDWWLKTERMQPPFEHRTLTIAADGTAKTTGEITRW